MAIVSIVMVIGELDAVWRSKWLPTECITSGTEHFSPEKNKENNYDYLVLIRGVLYKYREPPANVLYSYTSP